MLFTPLNRKLLRDLWRLKMQVLAIAFVVASGAALLIMSLTTIEALEDTTSAYYDRYRFADVFATVKRAPEALRHEIADIPGVQSVETRIVQVATVQMKDFPEPASAEVLSLPKYGPQIMNVLVLRAGRLAEPDRPDEVVVSEPFADAHNLKPGDSFDAVLRGRKRTLDVVGIALSPEFVYAIAPGGLMPDDKRFGVIWMGRRALEAAFDLKESFNNVTLKLMHGTNSQVVIDQLDKLLTPYGSTGAYGRKDQISNWFLMSEIEQQKNLSKLLPAIFLAVAAFLTNMVMARLIATERREIGLLKAFGYTNTAIGFHYAKMVMVIAGIGVLLGFGLGAWMGKFNTELYADFYKFPFLLYRPGPASFVLAAGVSLISALAGSMTSVAKAVKLPPAAAMQAEAPPIYRRGWLSRSIFSKALDEPTRMVFRRIVRWPVRAFLASFGLAMSVAVLVLSLQWLDAIDSMVTTFFEYGQHQDASLSFNDLKPAVAEEAIRHLPGVLSTEPFRMVPARFSHGRASVRQGIFGVPKGAFLSPVYDTDTEKVIPVPPGGVAMSLTLADMLHVKRGDKVKVEILEGRRPVVDLTVARIFDTDIGRPAYMSLPALNRLMQDGRVVSGYHISIDSDKRAELLLRLTEIPNVATILFRQAAIDTFHQTMGETMYIFTGFFVVFAMTLSFGVTYNSVRIALSERARELATLRVLGFSRWEISYILLGEIGLLTWIAIPLGLVIGYLLSWYMSNAFATELYRVPLAVTDQTYGMAAIIALVTTILCAALVRQRLDHLDLIAVLKTRE
ncbi:ABC transporter permease [Kordiimonas marina]|uniref:ABC transporter permease n=1 Tax=Kordiimonas marina TaxID=2872312 RepID=UPI001FF4E2E8|nr:FtsX-like permease family protein [Kordiimonas marina]MCJ9429615.1 FtsX-like permease family protein [Kordiimonas marina]